MQTLWPKTNAINTPNYVRSISDIGLGWTQLAAYIY